MNVEHVIGSGSRKATVAALAILVLATNAFGGGRETASFSRPAIQEQRSWFQRMFQRIPMEEAIAASFSPRDITGFVSRYISYRSDYGDHWASAEETWLRGKGDCEDFAVLVQSMCGRLGIQVHVVLYFPAGRRDAGHAVAVGRWQGKYWVSSNGSYQEADSLEGIRTLVARAMRWDPDELWYVVMGEGDTRRFVERDRAFRFSS